MDNISLTYTTDDFRVDLWVYANVLSFRDEFLIEDIDFEVERIYFRNSEGDFFPGGCFPDPDMLAHIKHRLRIRYQEDDRFRERIEDKFAQVGVN
jgi:hypothetical protein